MPRRGRFTKVRWWESDNLIRGWAVPTTLLPYKDATGGETIVDAELASVTSSSNGAQADFLVSAVEATLTAASQTITATIAPESPTALLTGLSDAAGPVIEVPAGNAPVSVSALADTPLSEGFTFFVWDGTDELPATLSIWNGSTELPVTTVEIT